MIEIGEDQETLYLTRGDVPVLNEIAFYLPLTEDESEKYQFQLTDKIAFVVKEKKGYTKSEVLRIEKTLAQMGYLEPTYYPAIPFTAEDTKKFELLDKKKTYWYDIVLNDTTTILGYDQNGGKKLIVFPEAGERS
jgi:hypothetical protein